MTDKNYIWCIITLILSLMLNILLVTLLTIINKKLNNCKTGEGLCLCGRNMINSDIRCVKPENQVNKYNSGMTEYSNQKSPGWNYDYI